MQLLINAFASEMPPPKDLLGQDLHSLMLTVNQQDWSEEEIFETIKKYEYLFNAELRIILFQDYVKRFNVDLITANNDNTSNFYYLKSALNELDLLYQSISDGENAIAVSNKLYLIENNRSEKLNYGNRLVNRQLSFSNAHEALKTMIILTQEFEENNVLLEQAISIAEQAGDLQHALDWIKALKNKNPEEPRFLSKYFEILISKGDLDLAIGLIPELENKKLYTKARKRKIVDLYLWTGQYQQAYKLFKSIFNDFRNIKDEKLICKLAKDLGFISELDFFLTEISKNRNLDEGELYLYADNLLKLGKISQSLLVADQAIKHYPKNKKFYVLAYQARINNFQYDEARQILYEINNNFGLNTNETIVFSNILWAQREFKLALEILQKHNTIDPKLAKQYWLLRTELALKNMDYRDAQLAWINASKYQIEQQQYGLFQHVLEVSYTLNNLDQTAKLAKLGFYLFNQPQLLLESMRYYLALNDTDSISEIIKIINQQNINFEGNQLYYTLMAQYEDLRGNTPTATQYWRASIKINHKNPEAVIPWLWFLVKHSTSHSSELEAALQYYSTNNWLDQNMLPIYAYGYMSLQQYDHAVYWFRRGYTQGFQNLQWLKGMSEALNNAGYFSLATRLKKSIFHEISAHYAQFAVDKPQELQNNKTNTLKDHVDFYGAPEQVAFFNDLQRQFLGEQTSWHFLQNYLHHNPPSSGTFSTHLANTVYVLSLENHWTDFTDQIELNQSVFRKSTKPELGLSRSIQTMDMNQIYAYLDNPNTISIQDQINAAKSLGRKHLALNLMSKSMNKNSFHSSTSSYKGFYGLSKELSPKLKVEMRDYNLNDFNSRRITTSGEIDFTSFVAGFDFTQEEIVLKQPQFNNLNLQPYKQFDLDFLFDLNDWVDHTYLYFKIGKVSSASNDKTIAGIEFSFTPNNNFEFKLKGSYPESVDELFDLKSISYKTGLQASFRNRFDSRTELMLKTGKNNFHSFQNEFLGKGTRTVLRADYDIFKSYQPQKVYFETAYVNYDWSISDIGFTDLLSRSFQYQTGSHTSGFVRSLPSDQLASWFGLDLKFSESFFFLDSLRGSSLQIQTGFGYDWYANKIQFQLGNEFVWRMTNNTDINFSFLWSNSSDLQRSGWITNLSLNHNFGY